MSKQSPIEDKTFKLTPYPSQQKGQAQIRSGVFSISLSIFLLITVMEGDWFTVVIAVYFLIVALQLILAGSALKRMPDRSRAVRIGPHGLYKMIEGSDVAQLPLQRVKALWKSEAEDTLWLSTHKGAQRFSPDDLRDPAEWPHFVTHLERSLSHSLWSVSEDLWRDVQQNSHQMKRLGRSGSPLTRLLVTLTAISVPVGAAMVTWSGVSLEQLVSGYPEVSFMLLGGSASWLNTGAEWGRVVVGPWMHFDLIKLCLTSYVFWWSARSLGRVIGAQPVLFLVLIAHALSGFTHQLAGVTFPLLGAFAPQVALLFAQWRVISAQPPGLDLAIGAQRNTLLWVVFAHILIISVFPEQALKTLSVDLLTGGVIGWIATRSWALERPLWLLQPKRALGLKLSIIIISGLTLMGFVSYGLSLSRAPLERLHRLAQSSPHDPTWNAQLGLMCAVGPCLVQTREHLQTKLDQDAVSSPLTTKSHPRTLKTHLSQLKLSLAQDLSAGALSERSIQLMSSRAVISPSASFVRLVLTALTDHQVPSEQLVSTSSRSPSSPISRLSLQGLTHAQLDPSKPSTLALKLPTQRSSERRALQLHAPARGASWRFEWVGEESPVTERVKWRVWLLIGEGEGSHEESLAIISLPLNAEPFELEMPASNAPQKSTWRPWAKLLTVAPQPSAAKSQRVLLWRAHSSSTP